MSAHSQHIRAAWTALLTLFLCAQVASARPHGPDGPGFGPPGLDGPGARRAGARVERQLRKHLIPPRLLMRHMDELKLTDEQRAQLKALMKSAQSQMLDLGFELKAASKELIDAVKDNGSAEADVLKRADALMALEAQQKRARLQAALKVRALLTPAQREQVKAIKAKVRARFKERRAGKRRHRRWGGGPQGCDGEGCDEAHK